MLNFGASKPRVKGGARAPGAPPWIRTCGDSTGTSFLLGSLDSEDIYRPQQQCFQKRVSVHRGGAGMPAPPGWGRWVVDVWELGVMFTGGGMLGEGWRYVHGGGIFRGGRVGIPCGLGYPSPFTDT